ncbi:MAG TPA: multicopper oxidase domain-containing protein [Candidatus Eisenbacteria bacterium]
MAGWKRKLQETARRNRIELVEAGLTRRDLFKLGLLTGSGYLVTKLGLSARALGADERSQSPPTTPWVEPLPTPPSPRTAVLDPPPTKEPQTALGERGRGPHQSWDQFYDPANLDTYVFDNRVSLHTWHRELPPDTCWTFNGELPGPRFLARYGRPIIVRHYNHLPSLAEHTGYGRPVMTTHLHNAHTPTESDGNPLDTVEPGFWKDFFYPNVLAGFTDPSFSPRGDLRETLTSLWYHDHSVGFTSQNVYRGKAGTYSLFNEFDTGDENDPSPSAFRLPSGEFDMPLVFHDRVFDSHGIGFFDLFNLDGILGDKFTVNGKIQPFKRVARRKYRFRMHNIGPSRWYQFALSNGRPMTQISADGNLLPRPITTSGPRLAVAMRADVILDFSDLADGTEVFLVNVLEQDDGRGPTGKVLPLSRGTPILKFIVDASLDTHGDPSRIPDRFYDLPPTPATEAVTRRTFEFNRSNGSWTVNGRTFDPERFVASPRQNTAEIWTIVNNSGGWMHPVHIHLEEHQMLSRNGRPPAGQDVSRRDNIDLGHGETVKVFLRFRDWLGRYPIHCHNVVHEDHAMMAMWRVVP